MALTKFTKRLSSSQTSFSPATTPAAPHQAFFSQAESTSTHTMDSTLPTHTQLNSATAAASFDFDLTQPQESRQQQPDSSNFTSSSRSSDVSSLHDNSTTNITTPKSAVGTNASFLRRPRSTLKKNNSSHSLTSKLRRRSSSSSAQTQISVPQPVPELPPLEVPEHYQDLTHLFDFSQSDKMDSFNSTPIEPVPQPTQEVPKHIPASNSQLPPLNTSTAITDPIQEQPEYEYYDLDYSSLSNENASIKPNTIYPVSKPSSSINESFQSLQRPPNSALSSSQSSFSPVSQQNSTFSNTSLSSTHSVAKTHAPRPVSTEKQGLTSKVRSMFPGFSLKSSNRSSSALLEETSSNVPTSFVGNTMEENVPTQERLSFTNKKPIPHFTEIDLGPTYKAQVVPVRNNSKSSSISIVKPSPVVGSSSPTFSKYDGKNESENVSYDTSETLHFVPNLRPTIDNVGSRLRSLGVPSPANLVMTKSQYEKYLQTKTKSGGIKEIGIEEEENEEDDEEDEDEDDEEDSDDENAVHARRVFAEDEAKKQDLRMRMRQDAHLSVYRQKMTKLTGSQIGLLNSSSFQRESVHSSDESDSEEDYDDVPLGILKAHGFPNHNRLKPMRSQPNLLTSNDETPLQLPGLLYTSKGDDMSIRSFQSAGAAQSPITPTCHVPEEGYLAMRNQSTTNIPGFNASVPMNRGLVGEIAKGEEAKIRRKSIMNTIAAQRTASISSETDSAYNNPTTSKSSDLQAQLQQMMHMQSQILFKMASTTQLVPSSTTPMPAANKANWSSFDASHQLSRGGAPSIRSAANSEISLPHRFSRPVHVSRNSIESLKELEPRNSAMYKFSQSQAGSQVLPARSSSVLVGGVDEDGSEHSSDDEEENEAGWKEMEKRRQQLRQLWKNQPAMVS